MYPTTEHTAWLEEVGNLLGFVLYPLTQEQVESYYTLRTLARDDVVLNARFHHNYRGSSSWEFSPARIQVEFPEGFEFISAQKWPQESYALRTTFPNGNPSLNLNVDSSPARAAGHLKGRILAEAIRWRAYGVEQANALYTHTVVQRRNIEYVVGGTSIHCNTPSHTNRQNFSYGGVSPSSMLETSGPGDSWSLELRWLSREQAREIVVFLDTLLGGSR